MFYVNNDDMDDLFRDAADKYPLKTDGVADWDKVSASLKSQASVSFAQAGEYKKEKKRRVFFWWLLLLPLGWIGHYSWQKMNGTGNEKKIAATGIVSSDKANEQTNNTNDSKNNSVSNEASKNVDITKNHTDAGKKGMIDNKISPVKSTNNIIAVIPVNKNKNLLMEGAGNYTTKQKNIIKNKDITNHKNTLSDDMTVGHKDEMKPENGIIDKGSKNISQVNGNDVLGSVQKNNIDVPNADVKAAAPAIKKTNTTVQPVSDSKQQAKAPVKLTKDLHFYAGLMAGVDISTVKLQSVKGPGYSAGLLLGYHFSKSRFSVETGIYWDIKKYYTRGEYFDKSRVAYLQSYNVISVNGTCNMFEIPINVRYDFDRHKNTLFYVTAGLSSYLMNKESYDYSLENSSWQQWSSSHSYYHSTKNWFSILNLSAGYEHQLGKAGNIRFEPYAKLPISGVGLGSLSISSFGLNLGLSRRF